MSLDALKAEVETDPLGRGYAGMTDQQLVDSLNAVDREVNRETMTGTEILNEINVAEWNALTNAQRQTVWDIVHLGTINPFGVEATLMTSVFGGGSATITALAAARKVAVSRAQELGIGVVTLRDLRLEGIR